MSRTAKISPYSCPEPKAFLSLKNEKGECLKLSQLPNLDGVFDGVHRNMNYTEG